MEDYYKEEENFRTLDKIDFLPYIKAFKGRDIEEMIRAIEDDYDHTELSDNQWCEGYIFNWVNTDELMYYLKGRYNEDFDTREAITNIIC